MSKFSYLQYEIVLIYYLYVIIVLCYVYTTTLFVRIADKAKLSNKLFFRAFESEVCLSKETELCLIY